MLIGAVESGKVLRPIMAGKRFVLYSFFCGRSEAQWVKGIELSMPLKAAARFDDKTKPCCWQGFRNS